MGVALSDLVPTLRRTLNPPGQALFVAPSSEWVGRLSDAFWDGRLQDFFVGYTIVANKIEPIDEGGEDLGRDLQTLIIRYAAIRALHAKLLSMSTSTRQKAGPVEIETQRSASLLVALLKDMSAELEQVKLRIRNEASGRAIAFLDAMVVASNRVINGYYSGGDNFGFVN